MKLIWSTKGISPVLALISMCSVGFILMLDRGVISSNGVGGSITSPDSETIVTRFGLSNFQSGCIPAVYFVGVAIGSPVIGLLSSKFPISKLIGGSFVLYAISQCICGFSVNYAMLLVFRFFVGFSGGTISLLPAVVDDIAPVKYAGLWLGILFTSIPLGFAGGYIVGGAIGSALTWRAAFWIQAGIAAVFAIFFLVVPTLDLKSKKNLVLSDKDDEKQGVFRMIWSALGQLGSELKQLFDRPVCVTAVLGMACWNLYLSTLSWWAPKATLELFYNNASDQAEKVDFIFGGTAAGTGIIGTLLGGVILDAKTPATLRKGLFFGFLMMAAVTILGIITFGVLRGVGAYWALLTILELIIFAVQPPGYNSGMSAVHPLQRPFVLATIEACQHLIGDIPGPPIIGAIQSATDDWHLALSLLSIAAGLGSVFFFGGWVLARNRPDYSSLADKEEGEEIIAPVADDTGEAGEQKDAAS